MVTELREIKSVDGYRRCVRVKVLRWKVPNVWLRRSDSGELAARHNVKKRKAVIRIG